MTMLGRFIIIPIYAGKARFWCLGGATITNFMFILSKLRMHSTHLNPAD